eukprot:gene2741-1726_t
MCIVSFTLRYLGPSTVHYLQGWLAFMFAVLLTDVFSLMDLFRRLIIVLREDLFDATGVGLWAISVTCLFAVWLNAFVVDCVLLCLGTLCIIAIDSAVLVWPVRLLLAIYFDILLKLLCIINFGVTAGVWLGLYDVTVASLLICGLRFGHCISFWISCCGLGDVCVLDASLQLCIEWNAVLVSVGTRYLLLSAILDMFIRTCSVWYAKCLNSYGVARFELACGCGTILFDGLCELVMGFDCSTCLLLRLDLWLLMVLCICANLYVGTVFPCGFTVNGCCVSWTAVVYFLGVGYNVLACRLFWFVFRGLLVGNFVFTVCLIMLFGYYLHELHIRFVMYLFYLWNLNCVMMHVRHLLGNGVVYFVLVLCIMLMLKKR